MLFSFEEFNASKKNKNKKLMTKYFISKKNYENYLLKKNELGKNV